VLGREARRIGVSNQILRQIRPYATLASLKNDPS
jgi:hypothetical protein